MSTEYVEIKFEETFPWGSGITLGRANKNRKYIKSLAACKNYASLRDIYPDVKNPLTHEMHSLWKLGLVKKYTRPKYQHFIVYLNGAGEVEVASYATRSWYKITPKGKKLLKSVGL